MAGTWSLVDLSNAFQGLLSGNELFTTKKQTTITNTTSNQSTYAPQTTTVKNLSLNLNSPNSSVGGGASATPTQTVSPQIITIPSVSPSQGGTVYPNNASTTPTLAQSISDNLTGILIIGGLGVGAYLLLKKNK